MLINILAEILFYFEYLERINEAKTKDIDNNLVNLVKTLGYKIPEKTNKGVFE